MTAAAARVEASQEVPPAPSAAELVATSRVAQGLPARVEDGALLDRIAGLVGGEPARRPAVSGSA